MRQGEYLLTVSNEQLRPMPMKIESHIGAQQATASSNSFPSNTSGNNSL
jgi:hypothetical protein